MFVSKGQIYVFIACVAYGIMSSIIFLMTRILKCKFKQTKVVQLFDVLGYVLISLGYIIYSHLFSFPNFRLYMPFGVLVGHYLSIKSFHITLAKTFKKVYNSYKDKKVKSKDERSKS